MVITLGQDAKDHGGGNDDGHREQRDECEPAVGGHQHHGHADQRAHRNDCLGEPGLQKRRQCVDVGGHARHDPSREMAFEVAQTKLLQVRVAAQPQAVKQALTRARAQHRHQHLGGPGDGDHAESQRADGPQGVGVARRDAAVDGRADQGGQGEVRQHADDEQDHGRRDQPAHRLEQVRDLEGGRGFAQLRDLGVGEVGLFGCAGQGVDTREQLLAGGDGATGAAGVEVLAVPVVDLRPQFIVRRLRPSRRRGVWRGVHQRAIGVEGDDLLAGPVGDDAAAIHDDDPVGMVDGGLAVRHRDHGHPAQVRAQVVQDGRLVVGVDGAGGVVEHHHGRARQQRAGQGDALALAAG